jgi:hypothetical protein
LKRSSASDQETDNGLARSIITDEIGEKNEEDVSPNATVPGKNGTERPAILHFLILKVISRHILRGDPGSTSLPNILCRGGGF